MIDHEECWNCGGEGRVAGVCIDGCCAEQDDPWCDYCSHRCEVCLGTGVIEVRATESAEPTSSPPSPQRESAP